MTDAGPVPPRGSGPVLFRRPALVVASILAFLFIAGGFKDLLNPMLLIPVVLSLYLLWVGRKNFARLLN